MKVRRAVCNLWFNVDLAAAGLPGTFCRVVKEISGELNDTDTEAEDGKPK